MSPLRSTYSGISFRGRLLLLLIVVSLVQALVGGITFRKLQSEPVENAFSAQLEGSLRGVAPVMDDQLQESARRVRELAVNEELVAAIEKGDATTAALLLGNDPVDGASDEPIPQAYVSGPDGEVLVGTKPDAPTYDKENVTNTSIRRGAQLLGTLHVPVVLDEEFMSERLEQYVHYDKVDLFVATADAVITKEGVFDRPSRLKEGNGEIRLGGVDRFSLSEPLLDGEALIGATVPKSKVAAEKSKHNSQLIGFLFALVTLMLLVSLFITRAVADALRRFADVARQLAAGDLSRRIPATGNDEVADLAHSFNDMAENLEQRIDNLTEARAKLRRQVDLFGEALANATAVGEMLTAVCGLALESTVATHARFWVLDADGHYQHAANIGLRPSDTEPCALEKAVAVKGQAVRSESAPRWLVVPARSGDEIVGLLTLVSPEEEFVDDDVRVATRIGVQAAVAIENARMHEQLRMQATRDGLTGLPNHRSLQDQLLKNLGQAYSSGMPLGVAMLDIDNFKRINDTYGHPVGDEAIKALAKVLSHGIGDMGMAARYGGEEFVVVMPGCDANASARIADRLREDVSFIEVPLEDGGVLKFTASFGVANVDQNTSVIDAAELLRQADAGLYNAKRTGKDRVCLAGPTTTVVEMTQTERARLRARELGQDIGPLAA